MQYYTYASSESQLAFDWTYSLGATSNNVIFEVSQKDNIYTIDVEYYIFDVYDWSTRGEQLLNNLHNNGLAQAFYSIGSYEVNFSWRKGERFYLPPTASHKNMKLGTYNENYLNIPSLIEDYQNNVIQKPEMFQ